MPDLITHTISSLPIAKITSRKLFPFFIVLGSTFPDLFSRTILVLFKDSYPLYWVAQALHSPILIILTAYMVTLLFQEKIRKQIFLSLIIGSALHLGLDLLQKHYTYGYLVFFPFSYYAPTFGLFWPEDFIQTFFK